MTLHQKIYILFGFYCPSRLVHSFWAEPITRWGVRWGENGRSPRKKNTWPSASRTWLVSHVIRARLEPTAARWRQRSESLTTRSYYLSRAVRKGILALGSKRLLNVHAQPFSWARGLSSSSSIYCMCELQWLCRDCVKEQVGLSLCCSPSVKSSLYTWVGSFMIL